MRNLLQARNWLTSGLILFMPISLVFFLGSQMAYSQVKGSFEAYQSIPEIDQLAELEQLTAGQTVILRGQIDQSGQPDNAPGELIIYQERPLEGREVRFQEEFPLVFAPFVLRLSEGSVIILPSETRERIIQGELHTVSAGDRMLTGFKIGDTVSVQGNWQPGAEPTLFDVTGITGMSRAELMADWGRGFQYVGWARNGLGLLTLLSLILLVIRLRHRQTTDDLGDSCPPQNQTTIPTA